MTEKSPLPPTIAAMLDRASGLLASAEAELAALQELLPGAAPAAVARVDELLAARLLEPTAEGLECLRHVLVHELAHHPAVIELLLDAEASRAADDAEAEGTITPDERLGWIEGFKSAEAVVEGLPLPAWLQAAIDAAKASTPDR